MSTSTIANTHANFVTAKNEVEQAKLDYDAARHESIAKDVIVQNADANTSDADKTTMMKDLVDAMSAEKKALLELRSKEERAAQLKTNLNLQEQLAKECGRILAPSNQLGATTVQMDASFINDLGLETTRQRTGRSNVHPVVFQAERRDTDAKSKKALFDDLAVKWPKTLHVGYGSKERAHAGHTATQLVQNK